MDVEEVGDTAQKFGVQGLPTIMMISLKPNGKLRTVTFKARLPCTLIRAPSMRAISPEERVRIRPRS